MKLENLKEIPKSLEAEKSVLGGIILRPEVLGDILEILRVNDF